MKKITTKKWIGLAKVEVLNKSNILNGANFAYTNVVGLSQTKAAFRNEVKSQLLSMELKLLRLEEVELFDERIKKFQVSKDILKIAKQVSSNRVGFSTFHTYIKN
jgi:hypothetical protein